MTENPLARHAAELPLFSLLVLVVEVFFIKDGDFQQLLEHVFKRDYAEDLLRALLYALNRLVELFRLSRHLHSPQLLPCDCVHARIYPVDLIDFQRVR